MTRSRRKKARGFIFWAFILLLVILPLILIDLMLVYSKEEDDGFKETRRVANPSNSADAILEEKRPGGLGASASTQMNVYLVKHGQTKPAGKWNVQPIFAAKSQEQMNLEWESDSRLILGVNAKKTEIFNRQYDFCLASGNAGDYVRILVKNVPSKVRGQIEEFKGSESKSATGAQGKWPEKPSSRGAAPSPQ
jgi:ABC-type Na+ efflux pump permease subunit